MLAFRSQPSHGLTTGGGTRGSARRPLARLAAALTLAVVGAPAAIAASTPATALAKPAEPRVTIKPGGFTSGNKVRVVVRGVRPGFRAVVGSRDLSSHFHGAGRGRRVAVLHRSHELRAGTNRVVVGVGRGADRRYTAATVVLGKRRGDSLAVRRLHSPRSALLLRIRGPHRKRFEHLRVLVNGRLVRGRSWVVGARTLASDWPLGRRSFRGLLGATDGVRFGRNRIVVTAWNASGDFDRVRCTVGISSRAPLPDAGAGARLPVGRTVRLDGRRTRGGGGHKVGFHWQIVRAPKGSKAKLHGARGARPRLVPDRPGTYRIRLLATRRAGQRAGGKRGAGRRAGASAMGSRATASALPPSTVAVDETTVQATPSSAPIGVPFQALTASGGVQIGSESIPAEGSWAQLVVLDRFTLEVKSSEGFGSGGSVSIEDIQALKSAVAGLEAADLVVITGGDRQVSGPLNSPDFVGAFAELVDAVGGQGYVPLEWQRSWEGAFAGGDWSIVGVPGLAGSAYQNLYGGIFGNAAEAGSPSGAISGYLQGTPSGLYAFDPANVTTFDTNVPGSPAGVNQIRIGDRVYASDPLGEAQSGFQVLVLNSLLEATYNHTFVVSEGFYYTNQSEVVAMQEKLAALASPNLGAPGYLIIVQSVGNPIGSIINWVDDEKLATNAYGEQQNATIPRESSTWFAPHGAGQSLAGALGELGGPLAHDQIAQMSVAGARPGEPQPAGTPGGYTLVASSGSVNEEGEDVDPSAAPVSRLQTTARTPTARVTGSLDRDRQTFWTVDRGSSIPGFEEPSLEALLYQAPQPWPLSQTAEQRAALAYLGRRLGLEAGTSVRALYYEDIKGGLSGLNKEVGLVTYRSGEGFDEKTFNAVQREIELELAKVDEVAALVKDWEEVFVANGETGRIDVQDIASSITESLESFDPKGPSVATIEGIAGESVWFASSLLTLTGDEEVAAPLGVVASGLDWMSGTVDSGGEKDINTGPVETEARELGTALATRLGKIRKSMRLLAEILVSDWGKLQAASAYSKDKKKWEFTGKAESALIEAVQRGTERELSTALLASTYGVYVVNPNYISSEFKTPAEIECIESEDFTQTIHPFADATESPASWISRTVAYEPGGNQSANLFAGLTLPADVSEDRVTSHARSAPQTVTEPLFGAVKPVLKENEKQFLGQDPLVLFADPRFKQIWFSCRTER